MAVTTSLYDSGNTTVALTKVDIGGATADEYLDEEPVHDAARDIPAAVWNKFVAYISEAGVRTRAGAAPAVFTFSVANLTSGQTDLVLARMEGGDADLNSVVAWRGGSVVGATARLEADCSAGGASAVVVEVRDDGTKLTNMPQLIIDDTTNVRQNRVNQLPGVDTFAALSLLDVVVTTDGSFAAGTTPTLWVDLYISYGGEDEAL